MVIVNIFAGLGNQMFQYATGRRLAEKLGVPLKLDLSSFNRCQFRKYQLDRFNLPESVASAAEVEMLRGLEPASLPGRVSRKVRRVANRLCGYRWGGFIEEQYFHFDPKILTLPDNVYLFGLWQTEKYFADEAEIIRAGFQLKNPPAGLNAELIRQIQAAEQAVSLHVRRGDYVTDPHSHQSHGVCGLDYYQNAIEFMTKKVPRLRFFVFSDEIAWARQNLPLPAGTVFVDHNGPDNGVEDIRLMSRCQHHIIANSSFSWWGAWLNPSKEKLVCAPKQWFGRNAQKPRNTADIRPASWTTF